ncbi:response regulator [Thalassomonas viridans]|uniref:histidine kinase n=1 Tax=Thalassomonas viridans TaxID=137584 RepID=A0AAF0C829_9GAMM|nr:ATP-binding protein [Thalassomonas viridans]WDE03780.1 response regulator [Thalassomonas viridans]
MQLSTKQQLLSLVLLATFIPYALLERWLSFSQQQLSDLALLILQFTSIGFLLLCSKRTSSRSLKLFWQYLIFAIVFILCAYLLPENINYLAQLLSKDFLSLFIYFFILLAIETNPHLGDAPPSKYISGRVPAIIFTVLCYGYLILLPAEFSDQVYQQLKPSYLFHILITGLIAVRLFICLISCQDYFWRRTFFLLTLAALVVMVAKIMLFAAINGNVFISKSYLTTLIQLLPYCLIIFAAYVTLNHPGHPAVIKRESNPEIYTLLLMLVMIALHLAGHELEYFYALKTPLQAVVVALWLIIGSCLLYIIYRQRRHIAAQQTLNILEQKEEIKELTSANHKITDAFLNSEDKAIVRASNNAILTTSVQGEILSANPAAVQMFQSLEQDLKGTNVSALFSDKDEMYYFFDFQSNVYSLQRKELGISVECNAVRSDGTEFPTQAELQWAVREAQPLIVITFINLTARKLAEKQALELKDKFIANISHEFRTPLTIINGIIDRYIQKSSNEEESDDLSTAKRNGLRLVRMVEQLLELSRLSDNPKLSLDTYRLQTLMAMPLDSFCRLSSQSKLEFSSQIPEDLWIECDAQAFEKIIFNLLANAVKYTPAGGFIKVNAYTEQDTIILDVIDSGIGINKQSQGKIFERFQRADDVLNQGTFGVGIGLSLVNELVKTHNWRINLVSEQGQGSKFSLSIPMASPRLQEKQLPISLSENEVSSLLEEQRTVSSTQAEHSHQVVLVIEDNIDMQSHIKQVIEQRHHCILAGSGELGLQLANEYLPDLIVCDLMLTGIDGFEVLQQIKQNEMTAHIPVILLTARSDLESRLQGLNLNADEYLSKPFNHNELLTRIQNLIENRQKLQQTYLNKFRDNQKQERRITSQENVSKLAEDTSESVNQDEKFLSKLEAMVAKHYSDPSLDISALSKELAMSERQLQRRIKVLLGTTPNNFIKEFRLKKAQELLKSGTQIGRIALDVGFSSQTYFGRCFKEMFQCTPKQYQQQVQTEEE